jgi:hypothetical protein
MKRLASAMMVGAVAVLLGASPARAQGYVYFAGGANVPVGSFKDGVKTGWIASAGLGANVGNKGLWVEGEGWYGSNKWKIGSVYDEAGKTNIWAALGVVGYDLMHDKSWSPYIAAGAGVLGASAKPEGGTSVSSTKFGYTGAVGIGFKAGNSAHIFVEARYLAGSGTGYAKMLPLTAGVSINFGKKKM